MSLSNVFKFTESLKEAGHQIGRKVGDALELLTFGMIERCMPLTKHLVVENGIEGATGAEHKVEFAFYRLSPPTDLFLEGVPTKIPDDLFGLIECKKVGVECTINNQFKKWPDIHRKFSDTSGYSLSIRSNVESTKSWRIHINPVSDESFNLSCKVETIIDKEVFSSYEEKYSCADDDRIAFVLDIEGNLSIVSPSISLESISVDMDRCSILRINKVVDGKIEKITLEDCLAGPQTPEKAKQCSFVSLDVRKRVLGHFDIEEYDRDKFCSIVVLAEISHWESKSRNMINLCNDYNLYVPDQILVDFLKELFSTFQDSFEQMIKKSSYQNDIRVKNLTTSFINARAGRIIKNLDNDEWVKFSLVYHDDASPKLQVVSA